MAAPGHEQLLVLQDLDTKIDQLRHRISHHPLQIELDAMRAQTSEYQIVVDEVAARKEELDRAIEALADDVAVIEGRRREIEVRLYDGSVTATKDLLAMQEEAKGLLERQTGIEDDELEIMEQLEPVVAEFEAAGALRDGAASQVTVQEAELAVAVDEVRAELAATEVQRVQAAALVPSDLMTAYESLRADLGGVAVARLIGSTCDGCHLDLSAVAFDRVKKLPDDAVVTCDQCGRLLIR